MEAFTMVFICLFIVSLFNYAETHYLSIDYNNKLLKATHCASGSSYGLIENKPADFDSLVVPFHP